MLGCVCEVDVGLSQHRLLQGVVAVLCFLLMLQKTSPPSEGHAKLNLCGSVTNYRLVCEIQAGCLSPPPRVRCCAELSTEAQLLRS